MFFAMAGVGVVAVAAVCFWAGGSDNTSLAARRTVLAVEPGDPATLAAADINSLVDLGGNDGTNTNINVVKLLAGTVPPTTTQATVMTDTNCAPDKSGISHFQNLLRLADGNMARVLHNHDMMLEPCLRPEETIDILHATGA